MSSTDGTFSGRSNQVLHLDITPTNNGSYTHVTWALYFIRRSGTGSFSSSPGGTWAVNLNGTTWGGTVGAWNTQTAATVLIASGAVDFSNGGIFYSAASASGVPVLGNASLNTADNTGPGAPGTPSLFSSTPSTINASWAGAPGGGLAIVNYRLNISTNPDLSGYSFYDTGSGTPNYVFTGLTPGRVYYVNVIAQTSMGFGPGSAIASLRVGIGGKRFDGTNELAFSTAVRWDGTQEVPITTAVRWDGTQEVPLT